MTRQRFCTQNQLHEDLLFQSRSGRTDPDLNTTDQIWDLLECWLYPDLLTQYQSLISLMLLKAKRFRKTKSGVRCLAKHMSSAIRCTQCVDCIVYMFLSNTSIFKHLITTKNKVSETKKLRWINIQFLQVSKWVNYCSSRYLKIEYCSAEYLITSALYNDAFPLTIDRSTNAGTAPMTV